MSRPTLLDDNDTFDTSKPFLVSERLDVLAYHMSLAPSLWEKFDPPSVSAIKSTTDYVEHDDKCTAKPLQGPPPNFIHELLQVTIDIRQDSLLRLAMKDSPNYFSFRSCLTARTMPYHSISNQNERDIVNGSLHTLIPLAAVLLLQLWIHDGASNDTQAFHMARDILMRLGRSTSTCDSENHAALGPIIDIVPDGATSVFAMVERMSNPFVEYDHQKSFEHLLFASPSQNCLNQEIVGDGPKFFDIQNAFINENPQSDGKLPLCVSHVDTLHLMAQVCLGFLFL